MVSVAVFAVGEHFSAILVDFLMIGVEALFVEIFVARRSVDLAKLREEK